MQYKLPMKRLQQVTVIVQGKKFEVHVVKSKSGTLMKKDELKAGQFCRISDDG